MLIGLDKIMNIAENGSFAIPAFNTYNMETVMGVIEAAEELSAPIIIQAYSRLFASKEAYYLAPIVLAAAKKASVPVCFHLDHGAGEQEVTRAIRYGCTGVMYDASALPFAENMAKTRAIAEKCGYAGISIEGELGHVGMARDGVSNEYTNVGEARQFAEQTGVCALAVQVGTAHGRYTSEPKLAIDRIAELYEAVPAHLVLHGGSGIPDEQIRAAIKAGIRKVNFGTDVCYAFLDKVFETDRSKIAVDIFMKDAIESVKEFAMSKIHLLGAVK